MIFDGHLSHLMIDIVLLAKKENISFLKLPAHCTDLLQPLDVAVFSSLKSHYEQELTNHVHSTLGTQPLSKALFTNFLSRVWLKGLSEYNIKKRI